MKYSISGHSDFGTCEYVGNVYFKADKASDNAFYEIEFDFPEW